MSPIEPAERSRCGAELQVQRLGAPGATDTLLQQSWRDYIFAEIWQRPGLATRARYWIAMAGAACEPGGGALAENYIRGALASGEVTLPEVREAALHLAVYAGFSRGTALDEAATRAAQALGIEEAPAVPIREVAWDPQVRLAEGAQSFEDAMLFPAPPPATPYFEAGILNFVFGEMWLRPGLDQRSRRWITLVGVADSSSRTPIRTHVYAAIKSGNASMEEIQEFVLQYAVHGGWPKASVLQGAVIDMAKLVAANKPYED
ncbi:gamma-carboxymuconolactone decarboxylase [Mangrovimicrobium sediminis]|uniref:Gamma-carboxymuconolactone decarboxylase n=1 Tax=Mangrovimicrobium sediminis TaxID=2562682 RepID=A0A4Z0M1L0_9GAMM|nr:carboxymuconolactone decarboxylase family protein [Haliea sp. SAOS-164]TGD73492.1 gamma-carboxymuconolactone decarboxylase [Haliea sp. SAOS-164]